MLGVLINSACMCGQIPNRISNLPCRGFTNPELSQSKIGGAGAATFADRVLLMGSGLVRAAFVATTADVVVVVVGIAAAIGLMG